MKRVVFSKKTENIELKNVNGSNTYVYITDGGTIYVLSKLGERYVDCTYGKYHYGFVNVSKINTTPTFRAMGLDNAVGKAMSSGRNVMEFNTFTDFMKWKLKL